MQMLAFKIVQKYRMEYKGTDPVNLVYAGTLIIKSLLKITTNAMQTTTHQL